MSGNNASPISSRNESTTDPPLYMSGRHFVEVPAGAAQDSRSSYATSHTSHAHHMELESAGVSPAGPTPQERSTRDDRPPLSDAVAVAAPPSPDARDTSVSSPATQQQGDADAALDAEAGASITDSEAARFAFQPDEDSELAAAVTMLNEHRKLQRTEGAELHLLELTSKQLEEMVQNANGMCDIEYFSAAYFKEEAQRVWKQRQQDDEASPDRNRTVRLFGARSAILAHAKAVEEQRARAAPTAHANDSSESFALKHPLLHRRAMRNEERRAAFRAAALERAAASEAPSMRTATPGAGLDRKSIYSPQRDLFGRTRPLAHFEGRPAPPPGADTAKREGSFADTPAHAASATGNGNNSAGLPAVTSEDSDAIRRALSDANMTTPSPNAASITTMPPEATELRTRTAESTDGRMGASGTSTPPTVDAGPKTLQQLLQEQKQLLQDMATHDETVYRPTFDAFLRYDEAVQEKMGRLLEIGAAGTDAFRQQQQSSELVPPPA